MCRNSRVPAPLEKELAFLIGARGTENAIGNGFGDRYLGMNMAIQFYPGVSLSNICYRVFMIDRLNQIPGEWRHKFGRTYPIYRPRTSACQIQSYFLREHFKNAVAILFC